MNTSSPRHQGRDSQENINANGNPLADVTSLRPVTKTSRFVAGPARHAPVGGDSARDGSDGMAGRHAAPRSTGGRVGHYLIGEKLGAGGVGEVYKGLDTMLKREVAIKVLRPELADDPDFVKRFHREAQTLANVSHPNIAAVHAFLREDNDLFMVMEYVAGTSLDEVIRARGAMRLFQALPIFREILRGIGYAHQCGIVHRDIKPSNIMLGKYGSVKVMDFGVARVLGSTPLTRVGQVAGTVKYMSPEQIRGEEVDARSDIYSLGIVLYLLLSGQTPFNGKSDYALMKAQVEEMPPPLGTIAAGVPPRLEAVVMRALEKRASDRFQSAEAFSRALDACYFEMQPAHGARVLKTAPPAECASAPAPSAATKETPPVTEERKPAMAAPAAAKTPVPVGGYPAARLETQNAPQIILRALKLAAGCWPQCRRVIAAIPGRLSKSAASTTDKATARPVAPDASLMRRALRLAAAGWPRRLDWFSIAPLLALLPLVLAIVIFVSRSEQSEARAAPQPATAQSEGAAVAAAAPAMQGIENTAWPHGSATPEAPPAIPAAAVQASTPRPEDTREQKPPTLTIARLTPGLKKAAASNAKRLPHKFMPGELISLVVKPSRDAYVYCYMQDERQTIQRFYPNRFSRDALVKAAAPLQLPGAMRFQLVANEQRVKETIACFATDRDVMGQLPGEVSGADFEPMPISSLEQVHSAFVRVAGATLAQSYFHVEFN